MGFICNIELVFLNCPLNYLSIEKQKSLLSEALGWFKIVEKEKF